jgi:hypothetical protein
MERYNYVFILCLLFHANNLVSQSDTLYFFNFEVVKRYTDANQVTTTVNNGGLFRDAAPFLFIGGTVSTGSPYRPGRMIKHEDFPVGKTFLYHSPTWYKTRFQGISYNQIELKLTEPLKANRVYLLSFLIGNFENFKYKPSLYGIKYSEDRILKDRRGGLLTKPDVLFPFTKDRELVRIQSVFTFDHDVSFIYFGCFAEDSTIITKSYDLSHVPKPNLIIEPNDTLLTRVLLDNILIKELHNDATHFQDVYFELNSDELTHESDKAVIETLATYMQSNQHRLLLQGYTDKSGSVAYNLDLSQRRANHIKQVLSAKGIQEDRIITLGKGKNVKSGKDEKFDRKVSILLFK